jgi:hypothetical protein
MKDTAKYLIRNIRRFGLDSNTATPNYIQTWNLTALANLLASLDLNPRISSSRTQLTVNPQGVYSITWKRRVTKKVSDGVCHSQTQRTHSKFTVVAYYTNGIVCSLKTAKISRKNPRLSWRVSLCASSSFSDPVCESSVCQLWLHSLLPHENSRSYIFLKTRYLAYLKRQIPYSFEWKKPLKGPRFKQEDNIKTDSK